MKEECYFMSIIVKNGIKMLKNNKKSLVIRDF